MLENLKSEIVSSTRGLNQFEADFQFDKQANSIGAIILHLAAVEVAYQKNQPILYYMALMWPMLLTQS